MQDDREGALRPDAVVVGEPPEVSRRVAEVVPLLEEERDTADGEMCRRQAAEAVAARVDHRCRHRGAECAVREEHDVEAALHHGPGPLVQQVHDRGAQPPRLRRAHAERGARPGHALPRALPADVRAPDVEAAGQRDERGRADRGGQLEEAPPPPAAPGEAELCGREDEGGQAALPEEALAVQLQGDLGILYYVIIVMIRY